MKYEGFPETNTSEAWYGGLKLRKYPQKSDDWKNAFSFAFAILVANRLCDEVRGFTASRKPPTDVQRDLLYGQIKYLLDRISDWMTYSRMKFAMLRSGKLLTK